MDELKSTLKRALVKSLRMVASSVSSTRLGSLLNELVVSDVMNRVSEIQHGGLHMHFSIPNALNQFRVDSFSIKEPETLEWIEKLPEGIVLWDIGANVGLYSIYAALKRKCRVFAFEPSVFNLELLARNIYLNGLQESITIVPLPLSDLLKTSQMKMTSTRWGGGTVNIR